MTFHIPDREEIIRRLKTRSEPTSQEERKMLARLIDEALGKGNDYVQLPFGTPKNPEWISQGLRDELSEKGYTVQQKHQRWWLMFPGDDTP